MDTDEKKYFYLIGKTRHGPVSYEVLRRLAEDGTILRGFRVWTDGMETWRPAASLPDLFRDLPPDLPEIEHATTVLPESGAPPPLELFKKKLKPRSPAWLGFWSFILPGVGPFICGQTTKGGTMMVGSVALHFLTGGASSLILCPVGSFDAILVARQSTIINSQKPWAFFPEPNRLKRREVIIVLSVTFFALLFGSIAESATERDRRTQQEADALVRALQNQPFETTNPIWIKP